MVLAEFVISWLDIKNTRTLQTPGFPGEFNIKLLLSVDDIKEDSAFFFFFKRLHSESRFATWVPLDHKIYDLLIAI